MTIKKYLLPIFLSVFIGIFFVSVIVPTYAAHKNKSQLQKKQLRKKSSRVLKPKASRYRMKVLSKDPYKGAVVIDAGTGRVLFEDHADTMGYPASMVKMMNFLIILQQPLILIMNIHLGVGK